MNERPLLDKNLDSVSFREWYWLKEELVNFCRENGLPTSGGKTELTDRIALYLDTGEVKNCSPRKGRTGSQKLKSEIRLDSIIEPDFVCSEKHRAFFKEQIGNSFSFNVAFQKWLKSNAGKTYAEAVSAYHEIRKSSTGGRKNIDRQFEYNTYVRDFFEHNRGRSLDDAIRCWKYKKSLPGHNRYEDSDLEVLKNG